MCSNPKRIKRENIEVVEPEIIYTGADSESDDETNRQRLRDLQNIEKHIPNARFCTVELTRIKVEPKIEVKDEPASDQVRLTVGDVANSREPDSIYLPDVRRRKKSRSKWASNKGKGSFACDECGKLLTKKPYLKRHKLIHSGVKRHKCEHCQKPFTQNSDKLKHERRCKSNPNAATMEELGVFQCFDCKKRFSNMSHLKRHLLIHAGVKNFACKHCKKAFRQIHHKNVHERICRSNLNAPTYEERAIFECEPCQTKFATKQGFILHHSKHTEKWDKHAILECDQCDKKFVHKKYFRIHQKIHGGQKSDKYKCIYCKKSFCNNPSKTYHELQCQCNPNAASREERATFECFDCKSVFVTKQNLKLHLLIHDGVKRHKCTFCKKAFLLPANKRKHEKSCKTNPNAAIFLEQLRSLLKCNECQKGFTSTKNLKEHQLTHTGTLEERATLKCDKCQRGFTLISNLRRHQKIHDVTKEERAKFKCDKCEKRFTTSTILKEHQRTHSSENRFKCSYCQATFNASASERRHSKICKNKLIS